MPAFIRIFFLLFLLTFKADTGRCQTIPPAMTVDWSIAGLQQFYVDTSNIADVTAFGAVGDGITNDFQPVLNAINSLSGQSGIVYFPPGTYLIGFTLNLPDSVVLKGYSSDATTLLFDLNGQNGNCINILNSQSGNFYPLSSGFNKGSFSVVCDSASVFSAGDYAELRQDNGLWDTNPAIWAEHSVGQMLKISGVNGDTIFLENPLRLDFDSTLDVEIRKTIPRVNNGVECMKITRVDSTVASVNYGIYMNYAAETRIRGVEMYKTIGAMIFAAQSTDIEVSGCYFHEAYEYDGTNTRGYGVVMGSHTGEARIENNIFRKLRHAMMVKQGANGNVFAYNYSIEPNRTEFPTDFGGDVSLHGHYPFSNLFEGNICQNLMIDQAYGPSGPFNTFFRNRIELYGIILSSGTVNTDSNNFAGNDITGSPPLFGNYYLTGTGHFEFGNNDNGIILPSGTTSLPDASYYLNATPAFWNIPENFPNIGTPNALTGQNIPARERWLSGMNFTVCEPDTTTGINNIEVAGEPVITLYPNPASDKINLKFSASSQTDNCTVSIYSSQGKLIRRFNTIANSQVTVPLKDFNPGLYLISVQNSSIRFIKY